MMERHEHTNPWADKLQEVQLPDANDSWNAMQALLDKEMPLGGQYDKRRWLLVILLLLLLIGVCNCPRLDRLAHRGSSASLPASDSSARLAGIHRSAGPDPGVVSTETHSTVAVPDSLRHQSEISLSPKPASGAVVPETPVSGGRTAGGSASDPSGRRMSETHGSAGPVLKSPSSGRSTGGTPLHGTTASGNNTPIGGNNMQPRHKPSGISPGKSAPSGVSAATARRSSSIPKNAQGIRGRNNGTSRAGGTVVTAGGVKEGDNKGGRKITGRTSGDPEVGTSVTSPGMPTTADTSTTAGNPAPAETPMIARIPLIAGMPTSATTGKKGKDSTAVTAPKSGGNTIAKKKPTAIPDNKQAKKSAEDTTAIEPDVKGFVAGIGFNQFFSVGQQQKSDYNSGGTSGGLGDYLPIPMVRYYFSRKLYVQLEAQFNAPQYTKKNLVAGQSTGDTLSPGRVQQSSVVIKKLFYFNLPLSIHYSPIKNLYVGAGLQYSRLSNGVGLYQDKVLVPGGADTVKTAKIYSFKGDSIYQKMRTNEFRVLFDLNYNYKRFIIGARYNQALSKFLNVRISDTQVTQARNSSLQLYIRYIIWDGRKRKASSSK